eukprot:jgi/Tetstr1/449890/TSEL_036949.t1
MPRDMPRRGRQHRQQSPTARLPAAGHLSLAPAQLVTWLEIPEFWPRAGGTAVAAGLYGGCVWGTCMSAAQTC